MKTHLFNFLTPLNSYFLSNPFIDIKDQDCQRLTILYSLFLGISFILLGFIFFFAFNWQNLSNMVKLFSIQALLVFSIALAFYFGIDDLLGKLSLTAASVFVGVFMAVFGQIYQTGADSYLLFLTWSAAIFVFVLLSSFAPLWLIFLILINTTLFLAWNTLLKYIDNSPLILYSVLWILNLAFLLLREFLINKILWFRAFYLRLIPYFIVQFFLAALIFDGVFDEFTFYSTIALLIHIGLFFLYRYTIKDITICAISLISTACFVLALPLSRFEFSVEYLVFLSVLALLLFAGIGKYAVMLYKEMRQSKAENQIEASNNKEESDALKFEQNRQDTEKNGNNLISESIEVKSEAKLSYFSAIICAISAIITTAILQLLSYFIFFEFLDETFFLPILAIICIISSVILYRIKNEYSVDNSYFTLYKASTLLLLGYALLTAEFIVINFIGLFYTSLIFTFITLVVTFLIRHSFTIYLINIYTFCMLFFAFNYSLIEALLLNITLILVLQLGYLFEYKHKMLKLYADICFMVLAVMVFILLLVREQFSLNISLPFLSIILALWSCINYILYTRKNKDYWKKNTIIKLLISILAVLIFTFFAYYNVYPILYIISLLIFSLYIEKVEILKKTVVFSIPILFFYYYNLDMTLLNKSITLFISGCILLAFAVYNKKILQHEKIESE